MSLSSHTSSPSEDSVPVFKPVRLLLAVFALLMIIFYASRWYAEQVSVPRYCQEPELVLQRLAAINTQNRPAGDGSRRDFIVAAKLEFLLPAKADEPVVEYLLRLRMKLEQECGKL